MTSINNFSLELHRLQSPLENATAQITKGLFKKNSSVIVNQFQKTVVDYLNIPGAELQITPEDLQKIEKGATELRNLSNAKVKYYQDHSFGFFIRVFSTIRNLFKFHVFKNSGEWGLDQATKILFRLKVIQEQSKRDRLIEAQAQSALDQLKVLRSIDTQVGEVKEFTTKYTTWAVGYKDKTIENWGKQSNQLEQNISLVQQTVNQAKANETHAKENVTELKALNQKMGDFTQQLGLVISSNISSRDSLSRAPAIQPLPSLDPTVVAPPTAPQPSLLVAEPTNRRASRADQSPPETKHDEEARSAIPADSATAAPVSDEAAAPSFQPPMPPTFQESAGGRDEEDEVFLSQANTPVKQPEAVPSPEAARPSSPSSAVVITTPILVNPTLIQREAMEAALKKFGGSIEKFIGIALNGANILSWKDLKPENEGLVNKEFKIWLEKDRKCKLGYDNRIKEITFGEITLNKTITIKLSNQTNAEGKLVQSIEFVNEFGMRSDGLSMKVYYAGKADVQKLMFLGNQLDIHAHCKKTTWIGHIAGWISNKFRNGDVVFNHDVSSLEEWQINWQS